MVIWLIGLAGAGKTTIGRKAYEKLKKDNLSTVFLDGDDIRQIMGHDLGHSLEERRTNGWRVCRICEYLDRQGINVVCAILSLFHEMQKWNRENYSDYFEVYLDVPMYVLLERDQKGLYGEALAGKIKNVAGVDLKFEPPLRPDLVLNHAVPVESPDEMADRVVTAVMERMGG